MPIWPPHCCIPEGARAPGRAGGTRCRWNGAVHRKRQPGSGGAGCHRGTSSASAPRRRQGHPQAPQGGGQGGSQRWSEDFRASWLSGEKFGKGVQDGCTGTSSLPRVPAQAPFFLISEQAASASHSTHRLVHAAVSPRHVAARTLARLCSETSAPAAPARLQLKFPGNGG